MTREICLSLQHQNVGQVPAKNVGREQRHALISGGARQRKEDSLSPQKENAVLFLCGLKKV